MNYVEAREYIKTLYDEKRIILGLERVERLMSLVGDSHNNYPCAIVTGTNGKGSTSTYLSSILKACGLKVGTNLSPHVQEITERFAVDLQQISYDQFANLTDVFKKVIETKWPEGIERPTFHEMMTAMSFYLFGEEKVDFAVMEVGMGGRYDACNIACNKLSVFTPIHYDHCRYLGDSLEAIAQEKGQIMKAGGVAVSAPQPPKVKKVLQEIAEKFGTHLEFLDLNRFTHLETNLLEPVKFKYKFSESVEDDICLAMKGNYQVHNAALAILAAEKLSELDIVPDLSRKLNSESIQRGLSEVQSKHLPARFEMVGMNPALIIDGGHNVHGIRGFVNEIKKQNPGGKVTLVMGFKDGKNYFDVLPYIDSFFSKVIFTNFEINGGVQPSELKTQLEKLSSKLQVKPEILTVDDPLDALNTALESVEDNARDLVAVAGSLYLAGEVKNRMKNSKENLG
jgi:dihydrofolate synthase/folylpolyglutamate synthase